MPGSSESGIGVILTTIRPELINDPPREEYGERPVMVTKSHNCTDCDQVHDIEWCPKCGSDIWLGFGLMFGSYGEYKACENEACDWHWLRPDWDGMGVEF